MCPRLRCFFCCWIRGSYKGSSSVGVTLFFLTLCEGVSLSLLTSLRQSLFGFNKELMAYSEAGKDRRDFRRDRTLSVEGESGEGDRVRQISVFNE